MNAPPAATMVPRRPKVHGERKMFIEEVAAFGEAEESEEVASNAAPAAASSVRCGGGDYCFIMRLNVRIRADNWFDFAHHGRFDRLYRISTPIGRRKLHEVGISDRTSATSPFGYRSDAESAAGSSVTCAGKRIGVAGENFRVVRNVEFLRRLPIIAREKGQACACRYWRA